MTARPPSPEADARRQLDDWQWSGGVFECIDCGGTFDRPNPMGPLPLRCADCKRAKDNKRKRERMADPEYRAKVKERQRERMADPEYRAKVNKRQREWQRERYATDPEYRAKLNKRQRERKRERMADPEYRAKRNKRHREWQRERMADPEYRAKVNKRKREWWAKRMATDPEYRAKVNKRPGVFECLDCGGTFDRPNPKGPLPLRCADCKRAKVNKWHREWQRERMADPEYRAKRNKRERERRRERMADPEYRAKRNKRKREWRRERRAARLHRAGRPCGGDFGAGELVRMMDELGGEVPPDIREAAAREAAARARGVFECPDCGGVFEYRAKVNKRQRERYAKRKAAPS